MHSLNSNKISRLTIFPTKVREKTLVLSRFNQQQGIALVSSLLLLLAITLVGVTSLRMNLSSEEMASNSYLRDKALQAAQLGLEYGEAYVRSQPGVLEGMVFKSAGAVDNDYDNNNDGDICTAGLCIPANFIAANPPEHWARNNPANFWNTAGSHIEVPAVIVNAFFPAGEPLPPSPPRFIIEFMGHTQGVQSGEQIPSKCDISPQDGVVTEAEGRVTYPFCLTDPRTFRVTALGTSGAAGNPVEVILQSTIITP